MNLTNCISQIQYSNLNINDRHIFITVFFTIKRSVQTCIAFNNEIPMASKITHRNANSVKEVNPPNHPKISVKYFLPYLGDLTTREIWSILGILPDNPVVE